MIDPWRTLRDTANCVDEVQACRIEWSIHITKLRRPCAPGNQLKDRMSKTQINIGDMLRPLKYGVHLLCLHGAT